MRSRIFRLSPLVAAVVVGGCQTYEPRPLDLRAHAEALRARGVADEGVRAYVERLREGAPSEPPFDPSDGLTLAEAEVAALVLNPDLRAQRLAARAPLIGAEHAGRWDDPRLDADVLRVLERVDRPWLAGVGIGFTLPLSGRLDAERAQARAEADVAIEEARLAEWELVGRLHVAWFEWSAAARRVELVEAYRERLRSLGELAERLAAAGEAGTLEARLLRIESISAAVDARAAAAEARAARLRIVRMIGLLPTAPVDLVPGLDAQPHERVDAAQRLLAHPRVVAATARYEVAEARLRREVRKQYPDLDIGPVYEHEEGQSRLGLGLGLPVPVFNANRREIAEAAAGRDAARAEAEAAYEAAVHEVAEAEALLEAASRRAAAVEGELAPLVDEQLREAEALVEAGEQDVLLLSEALSRSLETKVAVLEAAAEVATLRARLRLHLGTRPRLGGEMGGER